MGSLDLTFLAVPIGSSPDWDRLREALAGVDDEGLEEVAYLVGATCTAQARVTLGGLVEHLEQSVETVLGGGETPGLTTLRFSGHLLLVAGDHDEARSTEFLAIQALKRLELEDAADFLGR